MKRWRAWQQWLQRPQQASQDPSLSAPLLHQEQVNQLYQQAAALIQPQLQDREIATHRAGDQRGQRRGSGMDYDDSRPYHPGDDPRHMNWRLSARSGDLQMKQFREERRPLACVLLDRRRCMVFGSRQRLKITQAAAAATLATSAASLRGDQTAALILQDQLHWLEPREGRQAAFDQVHQFIAPSQPAFHSPRSEASLQQALAMLLQRLPDGSQLTLISDFADLIGDHAQTTAASLQALCSRHQVHAIHIADPAEIALPKVPLHLSHADNGSPRHVDGRDPQMQTAFERASAAWFAERKRLLTAAGASYQLRLTTASLSALATKPANNPAQQRASTQAIGPAAAASR